MNKLEKIIKVYGQPDKGGKPDPIWYNQNIIKVAPKWQMVLAWDTKIKVTSIPVHKLVAPSLVTIMDEIYNFARVRVKDKFGYNNTSEYYDKKTLEELCNSGLHLFGGSYNFRKMRGLNSLSYHSWGIAIDLDPANNSLGDKTYKMPSWAINIFESNGWVAGARWVKRPDAMHFEATGSLLDSFL